MPIKGRAVEKFLEANRGKCAQKLGLPGDVPRLGLVRVVVIIAIRWSAVRAIYILSRPAMLGELTSVMVGCWR